MVSVLPPVSVPHSSTPKDPTGSTVLRSEAPKFVIGGVIGEKAGSSLGGAGGNFDSLRVGAAFVCQSTGLSVALPEWPHLDFDAGFLPAGTLLPGLS